VGSALLAHGRRTRRSTRTAGPAARHHAAHPGQRARSPGGPPILEEAFVDHWDHHPSSYEEFLEQNVRQEDFDPGLWIVATDADALVGVLCGSAHADRGAVDWLGVLRSHRGRGVASALLREGFAVFRRRGLSTAGLSVDSANPTGAVSVYERQGMRVVASFDLWGRAIRGELS
jgi:ribosomal protein S18 acetylase RimI-like enzyme